MEPAEKTESHLFEFVFGTVFAVLLVVLGTGILSFLREKTALEHGGFVECDADGKKVGRCYGEACRMAADACAGRP